MSQGRAIAHNFKDEKLLSEFVPTERDALATIIMFPTVAGISELEQSFARTLAGKSYHAFLADLYGAEFRGAPRDVGHQQMRRLLGDRRGLAERLRSVLEAVRGLPEATPAIVAIGFCFGGLCALDLARTGADIAGVAAFHGLFDPPGLPPQPIKAKMIAFHGWDDPMVPPAKVIALGQEMSAAGADWQIHAYGGTVHAFTNPAADTFGNPATKYSAVASRRAWAAFDDFLAELSG